MSQRSQIAVVIGAVAVVGIMTLATVLIVAAIDSPSAGSNSTSARPGGVSGEPSDWLDAVCRTNPIQDSGGLPNRLDSPYLCSAAHGSGYVTMTPFASLDEIEANREIFARGNKVSYTTGAADGEYWLIYSFLDGIDHSGTYADTEEALKPLTQYGFEIDRA